jgi:uncharacterized protein YcgI (DUF1989 family)
MIREDVHEQPADNGTPLGENATVGSPIAPDGRPEPGKRYTVPAREGRAVRLSRGESLSVINTHGTQVCDLWAFKAANLSEYLSWEHARGGISRISPQVGDALLTNRRRPILTLAEDTSPGVHDTLVVSREWWKLAGGVISG